MKRSSYSALFAAGFAALAACSVSPQEDGDVETDGAELKTLELTCKSGSTTFDVRSSEGTLDTGAVQSTFTCGAPHGVDAGAVAGLVASCSERAQKVHPGRWEASITKSGKSYKATIKRGNVADLTLACTVPTHADAGGAVADAGKGGGAVPSYADVAPILDGVCGKCHTGVFDSVDKVKKRHLQMIDALSAGRMPRGRPTWKDSADGQKLLQFLRNSPEVN